MPARCCESGFSFPGTEATTIEWFLNTGRTLAQARERITAHGPMTMDLRTHGVDSPFVPADWRQLPDSEDFRKRLELDGPIALRARFGVPLRKVIDVVRIFEQKGHRIVSTEGYKTNSDGTIAVGRKKKQTFIGRPALERMLRNM